MFDSFVVWKKNKIHWINLYSHDKQKKTTTRRKKPENNQNVIKSHQDHLVE